MSFICFSEEAGGASSPAFYKARIGQGYIALESCLPWARTSALAYFVVQVCVAAGEIFQPFHASYESGLNGSEMIEAVLCDIDGTLVQSNWLHASAWKDAFSIAGVEVELEEVRRQIGKGGDELIPVFIPWWKRKSVEEPLKKYRQYIFRADYLSQVKPFPKARELLVRMKEAGIKVSLASSAHLEEIKSYRKTADIDDLVEESTSADDAKRSKPHPDIFLATLKKLGLPPGKVLALGDTPYDAEAAGKAEIWTVGVTTGGWNERDLLGAGCIEVYKDVEELLVCFEQSAFCTIGTK